MKIQELHLRNIASIQEADISFEKDLKDGITGKDANIFLISGDTGAGKSVILDGISMALYKNTPRIAGVVNINKNEFTDAEGENIRVGSIEQYTRLGISDKDKCYSEVAFIGNDNVSYRVRLSLGMLLGNRDKTTGKRPMKHRSPTWEMKIGSNDWTKTDESVISAAVGLTFQQFGRMAMLAQGQFAAFLTGDKKEREAILEQLTNTEHFTAYGKAIESLFKKAKEEKGKVETQYENESAHTLQEEKVAELIAAKAELIRKKADLDQKVIENDETLSQVIVIETNRIVADRETAEKARYEEMVRGEEYKSGKALVADWESTTTERQRLSDLKVAQGKLAEAKADEAKQKESFAILSADLQARREALTAQGDPGKAVDDKQAVIDSLIRQRKALDPTGINKSLTALSAEKVKLSRISTRAESIKADENAAKQLEEEIADDEKNDRANAEAFVREKEAYDAASAKKEETHKRFLTMQTGVGDAMIALRKRLVDEHAEVCPLCGQRIVEIHLEDELRQIVTPLEEEYSQALEEFSAADKSLKGARKTLDTFSGALANKKKDLAGRLTALTAAIEKLGTDAAGFGIDISKPLPEQMVKAQEALSRREGELKAAQTRAETLQDQITRAQEEKKPLDAALRKYHSDSDILKGIERTAASIQASHPDWKVDVRTQALPCADIAAKWNELYRNVASSTAACSSLSSTITLCSDVLGRYYSESGKTEAHLASIDARKADLAAVRKFIKDIDDQLLLHSNGAMTARKAILDALGKLSLKDEKDAPQKQTLLVTKTALKAENDAIVSNITTIQTQLDENDKNTQRLADIGKELDKARKRFDKWDILNSHFGGTRLRTLVQTYILRPLLNNANIYLEKITDRYSLTCSEDNEQLSILVLDRYNKNQIRSVTVLSGGERFMISLALSLALSSLNRPDMNVNILFIDEGFGTLDEKSLDSVMETLEKLQDIAGQSDRRVGIISHREELDERIPVQIHVKKRGEGRSLVEIFSGFGRRMDIPETAAPAF